MSGADHLLSEGCAAHSRNCAVRLEVRRPPSCSTTSGCTAGQTSSLSRRTWSKCCRLRAGVQPLAPILRPARSVHASHFIQVRQGTARHQLMHKTSLRGNFTFLRGDRLVTVIQQTDHRIWQVLNLLHLRWLINLQVGAD